MEGIIKLLPDHVANQIAAGEVVQRPASVVKELLENSIDAAATSISLIIKEAGKSHIQVVDNGHGMSKNDAKMCFERHATSKISSATDLFNLNTKGFRGEAMASIAAVSQVRLVTKTASDELGFYINNEGSKIIQQKTTTAALGTSVTVKNLFFNIPARRNFLKSPQVEFRHIIDEFQRLALAHTEIHFELFHNGSEVFQLPPIKLRQRIVNIFGLKFDERLVPVDEHTEILRASGFVLKPNFAKKSRHQQFLFVNNRFIKSGYLHHSVMSAFEGLLSPSHQPGYFLFLNVPKDKIDINIHPTKTEVKFEDEHAIYAVLRSAIKHSLGQFSISPSLDFSLDPSLSLSNLNNIEKPASPKIYVNQDFNPFFKSKKSNKLNDNFVFDDEPPKISDKDLIEISSKNIVTVFQLSKKYLIAPYSEGVLFVHQRRAHERILYEQYILERESHSVSSQSLALPLVVSLDSFSISLIQSNTESLNEMGFKIYKAYHDTIEFDSIPDILKVEDIPYFLSEWMTQITNGTVNAFSQLDILARTLAKQYCIPMGKKLESHEQIELMNKLFSCKEPDRNPEGKVVYKLFSRDKINSFFSL